MIFLNSSKVGEWCGGLALKTFKSANGGLVFRYFGGINYCHGGTAQGYFDTLFTFDEKGLKVLDRIKVMYH